MAKGASLHNSVLVFAGSDQIYGANAEPGPYSEDKAAPGNVYAETKLKAENEIAAILEKYYILRFTWMFSMPERNKKSPGFITNILKALITDTPVYLNENDYRGLTYAYEVIENFEKVIGIPYGCYNAGSENDVSIYELGETALDAFGASGRAEKILIKQSGSRRDLRISNDKLKNYGVMFSDSDRAIRKCVREFQI